jgi:ketosteroid isomerase-like protein
MNNAHAQLIQGFYQAFDEGNGKAMAACYAPDVRFSDPVFPDLRGDRAGAMWRMLTEGPGEVRVELLEHDADDTTGSAHWVAKYTFSETGRPVVNDIRAKFKFKDGLIIEHRDDFNFYAWSRQALGPAGLLVGWTPIVKSVVRKKAAGLLRKYTSTSGNDAK